MADTDIGAELYRLIKADFDGRVLSDKTVQAVKKKIENGTAELSDASHYSRRLGELLRSAVETNVREEFLPGENSERRLYFNIVQSILEPLLRDNYKDINAACAEIQRSIDSRQGIRLNPVKANFPTERVRTVCGAASQEGIEFDRAVRRMGSPAENITVSFYNDYVEKNAEFRSGAGLDCYIERDDHAGCCAWCASLAGRYKYPDNAPKDVYARHDNCTCDVSYVSAKGRQNVHSKKWVTKAEDKAARIEYSSQRPTVRTREQARAFEAELKAQRTLTNGTNGGIIYSISNESGQTYETYSFEPKVTKEVRTAFDDEFKRAEEKFGKITTVKGVHVLNNKSTDEGTYNDNSGFIDLRHAEKKKGLQEMARIARINYSEGKWSTADPHHVMRHEIGHAIQAEHAANDPLWNNKLTRIVSIYSKAVNAAEGYELPSRYSAKMLEEFISECIAAGYMKKQSRTVREICSIINEGAIL